MIADPLALAAVVVAVTALAFWLAERFAWARKASASLVVICLGALLSNTGVVAASSPVYALISGPVTSLAIVWLLLAVDLRSLRRAGPRMLGAFGCAVAATVAGAVLAFVVFRSHFPAVAADLAGVMVGTYSGGGLNFVAVGRAVELPGPLFAAATAADNVVTALWLAVALLLPVWLRRFYPSPAVLAAGESGVQRQDPTRRAVRLSVPDLAVLGTIALGVAWAAEGLAARWPAVPAVVWLTTLALAGAQLPGVRALRGSLELGTLALHLFFAVLGIGSRFAEIAAVGVEVFYFTVLVVLTHGVVFLLAARALRFDLDLTVVASQAAVGGPSTAMAMAVARERPDLTLPGAMVGLLGYAVGTYAGLAVAALLR